MKNILYFILFFISNIVFSQTEKIWQLETFDHNKIQYGFYIGFHQRGYALEGLDASIESGGGFQLGVLAEKKFSQHFAISMNPGMISSSNKLIIKDQIFDINNTYFHLPLHFLIRAKRINNNRPFLMFGPSINHNFSFNKNNAEDGNKPYDFKLKKTVAMGEIGIGTSIYFPYFIFTPSIKTQFAFQNEYIGLGVDAKNYLNKLSGRGIFVTLTFE